MTSPTARSLARLRQLGYVAEVVERRVPRSFVTKDLIGCIDVIAIKAGEPIAGVQVTSAGNLAARRTKALAEPRLRVWLQAGGIFRLHGWGLRGAAGTRKRWTLTEEELTLDDLDAAALPVPASEETARPE